MSINEQTDVPAEPELEFVNPNEIATTYRVCIWASPGEES